MSGRDQEAGMKLPWGITNALCWVLIMMLVCVGIQLWCVFVEGRAFVLSTFLLMLVFGCGVIAIPWGTFWLGLKFPSGKVRMPEAEVKAVTDELGISVSFRDKPDAAVKFDELLAVEIGTNDLGPFACDFYLCLIHEDGRTEIPMGAEGWMEAMAAVGRLPGFDVEEAGKANRSTEYEVFKCWERDAGVGCVTE